MSQYSLKIAATVSLQLKAAHTTQTVHATPATNKHMEQIPSVLLSGVGWLAELDIIVEFNHFDELGESNKFL